MQAYVLLLTYSPNGVVRQKHSIQPFPLKTFPLLKKIKVLWENNKRALCCKINVLLSSVLVEKNKVHNKQHKQWGNIYHTGMLARPQRMSGPTGPRKGSTRCHTNVFKGSPVEKFQQVAMPLVEWVTTPPPLSLIGVALAAP